MPEALGFQADLAHTYLYLLGYNAPEHALVKPGYSEAEFWLAYESMVAKLRPWTIDFHVAQNDGQVHGAGAHDKTGSRTRHQAHLLGRLHVPQRHAREPADLEHHPQDHDRRPRRPRLAVKSLHPPTLFSPLNRSYLVTA
jgi:hypothetical protein